MKLLALDPSGNHGKEGFGHTGVCVLVDGTPVHLGVLAAKDFSTETEYWEAHKEYIMKILPDQVVLEGYKLYNHAGREAKIQANSELQTPQLIGFLKMICYENNIPYAVQFASEVKTRWQEPILAHLGHLEARGGRYYFGGKQTVTHQRDALKHALHFYQYGRKKQK